MNSPAAPEASERLGVLESRRAHWIYCDPAVKLTPEQEARRDWLDAEIAALRTEMGR